MKPLLVMMRHGQSMWNQANVFTGWVDVPLSSRGIEEALEGGKKIATISFDVIFTSALSRAESTAMLAMSENHANRIPVIQHPEGKLKEWGTIYSEEQQKNTIPLYQAWELNERMYGVLQGKNKDTMREEYGAEQVHIWRRSFDVAPPEGESLEMTAQRTLPYFKETVVPYLKEGKSVFIAAHGNSLRAILMELDRLGPSQIVKVEIPTGEPIVYEYDQGTLVRCSGY